MHTKLQRIEELTKSGKQYADQDYGSLQNELEQQFGEFQDENTILKERVRKLKVIESGMSKKGYSTKSKVYPTGGHKNIASTTSVSLGKCACRYSNPLDPSPICNFCKTKSYN
jgi:hypothetical protein